MTRLTIKLLIIGIIAIPSLLNFLSAQTVRGQIHKVPQEFSTIQEAINASVTGDTVLVSDGFYPERVNFSGKNIVLTSYYILDQDSTHIYNTEINRNFLNEGVLFINGEGSGAQLIGFTISNCLWKAVHCKDSSPQIRHNIIKGNAACGIYLRNSKATISDNKVYGNMHFDLGGPYDAIELINSGPTIERNIINGDDINGNIHAIELSSTFQPQPGLSLVIRDNLIIGGISGDIPINDSPQLIHNNLFIKGPIGYYSGMNITDCGEGFFISNNTFVGGYGIWIQDGNLANIRNNLIVNTNFAIMSWVDSITVAYNNVFNSNEPYSGHISDQTGLNGNFSADPGFIDPDNGDYHLQCWSPCIDAGDPEMNFSNEPSPNGGRINIGRYGNTDEAAESVACIRLRNYSIDFGLSSPGEQKDSTIMIYNAGHDQLVISGISNSDLSNFSHNYSGGISYLVPGDSLPIQLSFHPTIAVSTCSDSTIINSNSGIPCKIYMTGHTSLGIANLFSEIAFFPLPFMGENIYLKNNKSWPQKLFIEIYSVSGEKVYSNVIYPENRTEISITPGKLTKGLYLLRITSNLETISQKFISL
jgi:parallel beta-helix repeat protein